MKIWFQYYKKKNHILKIKLFVLQRQQEAALHMISLNFWQVISFFFFFQQFHPSPFESRCVQSSFFWSAKSVKNSFLLATPFQLKGKLDLS